MKILKIKIILFLLLAIFAAGCKKKNLISEKQEILFQVEYINYAWGYQHYGFIIDNVGDIMTFKNPEDWNFPDKDFKLSADQVKANLAHCFKTGKKINPEELRKYSGYIKNISSSKVTALKNVAADAGSLKFICYQFEEKTSTYKGCLIKMEGDFTCENLNFYSKKVATWLKSINDSLPKK
jgi:hypothetical protein